MSLFTLVSLNIHAQELDARVTINYEQLLVQYKEHLENFLETPKKLNNKSITNSQKIHKNTAA